MSEKPSSTPDEIRLSAFLDGEIPPEEAAEIESRIQNSDETAQAFDRLQSVSSLTRESGNIQLSDDEKHQFDLALARKLEGVSQTGRSPFAWIASFGQVSWQWRTATVLILMLIAYIPFMTQSGPGNSIPDLVSDFTNATISSESNPEEGYDMIWVFTQEEEDEENDSPIGFFPLFKV